MNQSAHGHKKKIGLYLGVKPHSGGMFQYSQSILEALSELNDLYDVVIVYDKRDKNWRPILSRFKLSGITLDNANFWRLIIEAFTVFRVPAKIARYLGKRFNPLLREILAINCDLWIFPSQDSLTYQVAMPTIGTIHDLMHRYESDFPEVGGFFRRKAREHRLKNIAKFCSGILVDSNVGKTHVLESYGTSEHNIHVLPYVYPGYLTDTFERLDFDSYYQLPAKFLFYPAQFWEHKNHFRLLEAIKLVSKRIPDVKIVFSGGVQYGFKKIKEKINSLGLNSIVMIIGHIPDSEMSGFYRRARALVMPTFFGPTNIPPLEAMLIGCPVLVSGIYGMKEQCRDAAIYFDPKSVDDIATAILRIWSDDQLAKKLKSIGFDVSALNNQKIFNQTLSKIININLKKY